MKLSKDDLFYIFDCADDPDQHVQGGLDMNDIKNALIENDLEIEGYIREDHFSSVSKMVDEWTRFDADDPKTFPKEETDYIVLLNYGEIKIIKWWESIQAFTINYNPNITHWRPIPSLPVE